MRLRLELCILSLLIIKSKFNQSGSPGDYYMLNSPPPPFSSLQIKTLPHLSQNYQLSYLCKPKSQIMKDDPYSCDLIKN
jgi:hypothetical protein